MTYNEERGRLNDAIAREKTLMMQHMEAGVAEKCADRLVELGRVSVLQDFDAVCIADGFMGFSAVEWAGVRKFFAMNKAMNGGNWDV